MNAPIAKLGGSIVAVPSIFSTAASPGCRLPSGPADEALSCYQCPPDFARDQLSEPRSAIAGRLCREVSRSKRQRQQLAQTHCAAPAIGIANVYRRRIVAKFMQPLAAAAARRNQCRSLADNQHFDNAAFAAYDHRGDVRSLGAAPLWEGGVLDIASRIERTAFRRAPRRRPGSGNRARRRAPSRRGPSRACPVTVLFAKDRPFIVP